MTDKWEERIKRQYPDYMVVYPSVLSYKEIEAHWHRYVQMTDVWVRG